MLEFTNYLFGALLEGRQTRIRLPVLCELHLQWYGKTSRPGRKIGHVNVRADNQEELAEKLEAARSAWTDS
ncbi:hypothetical protein [Parendozoicomonas sp. Alg238-R29]|uniref:hypothetical protein n=1 Tax=Parendozoicomonas sp. Alg238-R29 TaxID=2993446 RepID=UPI00248DF2B7|nr:hypothetical protein [Parendozoicomonas sp. Alg238-R29]